MRGFLAIPAIIACGLLTACGAAVSSTRVSTLSDAAVTQGRNQGEVYYLPRALLMVKLVANPATGLRVVIDQPDIVADTGASLVGTPPGVTVASCTDAFPRVEAGPYILSHRFTGFHKDTITIETERSLLKSVVADTEEQTTEALANLAKSVAAFSAESAVESDDEVLLQLRFDPADCQEVANVQARIRAAIDGLGITRLKAMQAAGGANSALAKLSLTSPPATNFELSVSGFQPFRLPVKMKEKAKADCSVGVCVPVQVPASIVVEIGGRRLESPVLHLPNRSDPVAIPVSRSGFADVKTTLTLDRGILTKREVVRTSEVAAILLLPATLVSAYLGELSSTFKKRKTAVDDEMAWREAQEKAKEKAESADLAPSPTLLEMAVPGLSVAGAAKVPVTPIAPPVNPPVAAAGQAGGGRQTSQGNGQADPVAVDTGKTNAARN